MEDALFDEICHISIHKSINGRMNLQKNAEEANRKASFTSLLEERIAKGGSVETTLLRIKKDISEEEPGQLTRRWFFG